MGKISDKENTYSFWGHYIKGQGHRQLLWVFYIPFSNATLCCDNWDTFLQRTFKLGQNVCLGKILVNFEYPSSRVCLSVHPSVHTFFVLFEYWSSGVCLSVRSSACPHFICAAITGILFYRELSNFVRMFVWVRSRSTSNIAHLGSVCLSVRLSTLSLFCDNWNASLQRNFKLCIWVIYQIRGTPIVFGVNTSKVKVTCNFFVCFFFFIPFSDATFFGFFFTSFSNATLNQIRFDPFQTWNMDNMSDMGNTYCFWGHFVKGHGHFHGPFSCQNSYNIIPIQYKFAVVGPYLTWSVF